MIFSVSLSGAGWLCSSDSVDSVVISRSSCRNIANMLKRHNARRLPWIGDGLCLNETIVACMVAAPVRSGIFPSSVPIAALSIGGPAMGRRATADTGGQFPGEDGQSWACRAAIQAAPMMPESSPSPHLTMISERVAVGSAASRARREARSSTSGAASINPPPTTMHCGL